MVKPEPRDFPPGIFYQRDDLFGPFYFILTVFKQLTFYVLTLCGHRLGGFLVLSWSWVLFVAVRAFFSFLLHLLCCYVPN